MDQTTIRATKSRIGSAGEAQSVSGFLAQPPKKGIKNWPGCCQPPFAIGFEVTFPKTMVGVALKMCSNAEEPSTRRRELSRKWPETGKLNPLGYQGSG